MIRVALIGAGGMGRVHLRCYRDNPAAKLVALCDVSAPSLRDAGCIALRKNPANPEPLDLTGVGIHEHYQEVLERDDVDLVDICLPSRLHAPVSIAALRAGKHVFCEKPMAMSTEECRQMEQAWRDSGRQLIIGHSLRYMPQYVEAHKVIASGRFGTPLYARFERYGGRPLGSYNNWLTCAAESGGVVLDLHIHDIDTAHWWFGRERAIHAFGVFQDDLPVQVDSLWHYPGGPQIHLHAGWDVSPSTPFRFAFHVMLERGSVMYDSSVDSDSIRLYPADGGAETVPFDNTSANQLQVNDIIDALATGRRITRITPPDGTAAVAAAEETLRQVRQA